MATKMTKLNCFRVVATRSYSAAAVPIGGVSDYNVEHTQLPNKLVVASADNEAQVSRISIILRAGSRNESPDELGVTHVLRVAAGLTTNNASQFAIARNIQQAGASLTVAGDRECIAYTLVGTRQAVGKTLPFLTEVVTEQVFKPWELSDNMPRLKLDVVSRTPQLRVVELLHKAAFRTGLGNSLYCPKYKVGSISSETLQHYVSCNFGPDGAAVVGLGVDHSELVDYATGLELEEGGNEIGPSPYKGGEIRSPQGGNVAYVAVAGQGGSLKKLKKVLAFAVLQKCLGVGSQIKWAPHDQGILSKAVSSAGDNVVVSALNANYSDAGLFGALIETPASSADKVTEAVVGVLKGGEISDADFCRGKALLKLDLLTQGECGESALQLLGTQAALMGNAKTPTELVEELESLTPEDVTKALEKVGSGPLSIASFGDLRAVPYLDDLA